MSETGQMHIQRVLWTIRKAKNKRQTLKPVENDVENERKEPNYESQKTETTKPGIEIRERERERELWALIFGFSLVYSS